MTFRHLMTAVATCCALVSAWPAGAGEYPSRPVRIIVPYAPGGTADTLARLVAKHLQESLNQAVVIENRGGAAGLVGAGVLAHSAPDGYTFGVLATPHAATPIDQNSGFDPKKVKAVALIALVPGLLCVNASVPAKSLSDIISLARAKPGELSYGNAGNFSAGHLAMEMFKAESHVDIISVPYKGGAPALQDLLAGQTQMSISGPSNYLPYIKTGQLRPIASTGLKRSTAVPDVPTFSESGMTGFEIDEWYGIFAPRATPPDLIARINHDVVQALDEPDVRTFFASIGAEPGSMSPGEYDAFFKKETQRLGKLVSTLGLKTE
jgi:tripartite-type tricarboxylate transporter receptor subunit TctC